MAKLRLSVACGDYDIVKPLIEGTVQAEGLELVFLTDMGPRERHWRMGRKHEFDVCEENIGAYFMMRDQDEPLTAIPVFLHRRFRHGFVFINTAAGIREPKDLAGKTVGGTNFQPASNIWMRGILEEHYGVPHRSITWLVDRSEDVAFQPPPGLRIEMKTSPKTLGEMLADGDIPAMISPTLPRLFVQGDKRIARLFVDYKAVEIAFFRQTGIFQIMHVTTVKQEIVEKYPWVPTNLTKAFEAAKQLAYRRLANPRMVPLAFVRTAVEEQEQIFGKDPCSYGLTANRKTLATVLRIAANRSDTDTEALLETIVAGTEAMVRLGLAISGPTVLYRGIWPTYFAAPFGVAAATARLDNLDAEQTAHALALALTFASPGVGHHNAARTSRWFAIGHAARNGLIAVEAAQTGFTSDLNLLEGSFLDGIYGITPNVTAFTENLGQRFALDDISFKPWCAARQTIAATQALLEIIESGVSPDAIVSVEVHVPSPYLKMINHGVKVGDRASHLTSVQYHLALAARDLSALYDVEHSPQRIADDVQAFMQKVSVSADEALLAHYPKAWPARVVVHTSGAMQELIVIHGWGDPQRPFDDRRIEEKFRRILAPTAAAFAQGLLAHCRAVFDTNRSPAALAQDIARVTGRALKT